MQRAQNRLGGGLLSYGGSVSMYIQSKTFSIVYKLILVAHFLLGARFSMGSSMGISMLLVHYVVPIMTISDWLLFDKKGSMKKTSPLIWAIGPLAYFAYIMVAAQMGGRYPYPFIDVDMLGWSRVLVNGAGLTVFFIALGYGFVGIEKMLMLKFRCKTKACP